MDDQKVLGKILIKLIQVCTVLVSSSITVFTGRYASFANPDYSKYNPRYEAGGGCCVSNSVINLKSFSPEQCNSLTHG